MPQTTTTLTGVPGQPGQLYDLAAMRSGDMISLVAGTTIPFGVLCELNSTGVLQPVQDTNANWPPTGTAAGTSLAGISVWDPMGAEQGFVNPAVPPTTAGSSAPGYLKGQRVPVLRRGRIWVPWDGGGMPTRIGNINVWHSSDASHPQGVFTFSAANTGAGVEVSICPSSIETFNPDLTAASFTDGFGNTVTIIVVSIDLPGQGS